jgi:hypothetical protein
MYKGLSPYEFTPMPGVHKALQPTPESDRAAFGGSLPGRHG